MRFLRRGGRDGALPVEHEDEAAADERVDATAHPAWLQPAEPTEADAEPEMGAVDNVDPKAAAEPEASQSAEAEPEPEADAVESVAPDPDTEAEVGAVESVAPEAGADPADPADTNLESIEDQEGLSGLVAGGVRPPVDDTELAEDEPPDALADGRPAALRIAGLHLRTGQHALARAQLEALSIRGQLDDEALLDLAEIRWRTGDLAGAGDTANTLIAGGSEAPLALVIAAEAVAAAGRPMEARRLSARAVDLSDGPLDPLFAGMPRAAIWPGPASPEATAPAPRRRTRRPRAEADGAPTTASEAFAGGRAALARGDANRAGLLLGVSMRLEPGFADDVLRAVQGRDDQPLLALVRGDALRLLGREAEALEAFDRARGRSAATNSKTDEPLGLGLFDEDQG